jgi:hypothetical protein
VPLNRFRHDVGDFAHFRAHAEFRTSDDHGQALVADWRRLGNTGEARLKSAKLWQ